MTKNYYSLNVVTTRGCEVVTTEISRHRTVSAALKAALKANKTLAYGQTLVKGDHSTHLDANHYHAIEVIRYEDDEPQDWHYQGSVTVGLRILPEGTIIVEVPHQGRPVVYRLDRATEVPEIAGDWDDKSTVWVWENEADAVDWIKSGDRPHMYWEVRSKLESLLGIESED